MICQKRKMKTCLSTKLCLTFETRSFTKDTISCFASRNWILVQLLHLSMLTEREDKDGKLTLLEWASCMRSVLRVSVPWLRLRRYFVDLDVNGKVDFVRF